MEHIYLAPSSILKTMFKVLADTEGSDEARLDVRNVLPLLRLKIRRLWFGVSDWLSASFFQSQGSGRIFPALSN